MKLQGYVFVVAIVLNIFYSCKSKSDAEQADNITPPDSLTDIPSIDTSSSFFTTIPQGDTVLSSGEILLKFNPSKGKSYNTQLETVSEISQTYGGENQSSKMNVVTSNNIAVGDIDNEGNYILTSMVKTFKATVQQGEIKTTIENGKKTDDANADMMRQLLDCYVDMPVKITMNKQAEVQDLTGVDAIENKINEKLGEGASATMNEMGDLNQETLSNFVVFSDAPVKPGDSWQTQDEVDLGGFPSLMKNKFTLKDITNNIATVDVISNFVVDRESIKKMGGTGDEITMNGTQNGTMKVDMKTGWTYSSEMQQTIKMKMDMQGQPLNITVKGSSTMKTMN